jgi:hypothetical protein
MLANTNRNEMTAPSFPIACSRIELTAPSFPIACSCSEMTALFFPKPCSGLPAERKSGKESSGSNPSFVTIARSLTLVFLSTLAFIEVQKAEKS